ncbi:MAG: hypothetical protein ACOYMN_19530 [Roseimicrobium sp.]
MNMEQKRRWHLDPLRIRQEDIFVAGEVSKFTEYQIPVARFGRYEQGSGWKIGRLLLVGPSEWDEHDISMSHLYATLGYDWAGDQMKLPPAKRHIALRWYERYQSWQAFWNRSSNRERADCPIPGGAMELAALATDLYYLRHADALPAKLISRIKHSDQFQGARYEVAIAGALARLGFEITWQEASGKHHDFDARCPSSGESFAIETKSRHVQGTLHTSGPRDSEDDRRFKGHRQYQEAARQGPSDRPFIICIDLNAPMDDLNAPDPLAIDEKIHEMATRLPGADSGVSPQALLVFTNFSWHYNEDLPFIQPGVEYVGTSHTRKNFHRIEPLAGLIRALDDRCNCYLMGRVAAANPPRRP